MDNQQVSSYFLGETSTTKSPLISLGPVEGTLLGDDIVLTHMKV